MTRSNIVFAVLLLMLVGLGAKLTTRELTPGPKPEPAPSAKSATTSPKQVTHPPPASGSSSAAPAPPPRPPTPPLGRTLRVAALGWPLLTPGVAQNGGLEPSAESAFGKAGLSVALMKGTEPGDIERALARGGADPKGADVAIVPLSNFVASYSTLRALDPVMFLVTSWSRGRHLLLGSPGALKTLPKTAEVLLQATPGSSECFLGIFGLSLAGVPAERIRLAGADPESGATFAGVTSDNRGGTPAALRDQLMLSTAVATRAIAYVAIAQRSLLDNHSSDLQRFASLWLEGQERVKSNAPEAARAVAKLEGSPEPLSLLDELGKLEPSDPAENLALLQRSASTGFGLMALFERDWQARQAMGLISEPPPERAPLTDAITATLGAENTPSKAPTWREGAPPAATLFTIDPGKLDDNALMSELAFLAGVFQRSELSLAAYPKSFYDDDRSKALVASTIERFSIPERQLKAEKLSPHSLSPYRIVVSEAR